MTQTMEAKDTGLKLEITRVIRASRSRVFEAWTRPEIVQKWFGPGQTTVPAVAMDVRPGGEYRIEMLSPTADCAREAGVPDASKRVAALGVYQRIVKDELLEFTWRGDWEGCETSLVTVSLKDVEGGTELTLRHERFATEASRNSHEKGWTGSFEKLAKELEQ
jgi:uncharacterized protein YndB with AHSA1/START domain